MGLDLYAGTLTRYYSGRWRTVSQQRAEDSGLPLEVIRPESSLISPDMSVTHARVSEWRASVSLDLERKGILPEPFEWPENAELPYFSDRPGWDAFGALQILAAYSETATTLPTDLPYDWEDDRVYLKVASEANKRGSTVAYPHLYLVQWWFPVGNMAIFATRTPVGIPVRIASLPHLIQHLVQLNSQTLRIDDSEWNSNAPIADTESRTLLPKARVGLAIALRMAVAAFDNRLPMLLDY